MKSEMRKAAQIALFGALAALAACSGRPIDPALIAAPDEIPPGRGLLSGEDGEFRVEL